MRIFSFNYSNQKVYKIYISSFLFNRKHWLFSSIPMHLLLMKTQNGWVFYCIKVNFRVHYFIYLHIMLHSYTNTHSRNSCRTVSHIYRSKLVLASSCSIPELINTNVRDKHVHLFSKFWKQKYYRRTPQ